ncbi:putative bifunctional diguanylate cyclase/phosphodiesterase [Paenirhodobacter sp.]|uniref:putative bifunctional diguanylate cyclase/phosphodiesterase n=1 Tax=Paenirhodobacter sp. TaxID=1965326 RepID=UPI003B508B0D
MTALTDNPELLKARYRAFSRQMPMLYLVFILSTWGIAATYMPTAPHWLTIGVPLAFTAACATRVFCWSQTHQAEPTEQAAARALRLTHRFAFAVAIACAGWSFLLYPYGADAYADAYLAFYATITVISCLFSLMPLRAAAIAAAGIINGIFLFIFAANGQPSFIATVVNVVIISAGTLAILTISYRDLAYLVTAQMAARRKEIAQNRLLRMIDDMPVAVMTVEPDTLVINYANETSRKLIRSIEHLLPISGDQLEGTCIDVFHRHPEHQRRLLADPANLPHSARIQLGPEVLDLKVTAVTDDDGSYIGPMLTWAIVTKEVEAEKRIRQLAHYDTLTGLANRTNFRDKLDAALRGNEAAIGLLFIDLDGFKLVNDTNGHRIGDGLLMQVADRLREVCNAKGMVIGRLGGDEFAVLVPDTSSAVLERLAARIIAALSTVFELEQERQSHQVKIGASVGIAIAPDHADTGDALLSRADIALYAAKNTGKGVHRVFTSDIEDRTRERARLQTKLLAALQARKGLFVFYQPIIDALTKQVTAREALVRWHHPQHGWISPGEFIPIAEQNGLIDLLGEFVLDTACRDAMEWGDGARVAVNVSAAQLGKGMIVPAVQAALASSGLPPNRLEIEVTETAMFNDEHRGVGDLHRIRDLGVRVALDDFGTGYSSLTHLRAFPFDKIKIDGSFVQDAVDRPEAAAVVRALADLGKRLGVTTVAEGVETAVHLARVLEEGCVEVQGYFYGRPAPSERDAAAVARLNETMARIQHRR